MQTVKEKILITVKSAPTVSAKYTELVCTAGIREDGSWVRIHPIPFRLLPKVEQFKKFSWVECELTKNVKDRRPESFRPVDIHEIHTIDRVGTDQNWLKRRQLILDKAKVYDNMDNLKQKKRDSDTSLAIFKPTRVTKFENKKNDESKYLKKLRVAHENLLQDDLFDDNEWRSNFQFAEKIPYNFYYKFEDVKGVVSTMQILDWEISMLYRNCLKDAHGDTKIALEKVYDKYFTEFTTRDLHFFLGTTFEYHYRGAANPFTIVGVFPIPYKEAGLPGFD